MTSAFPAGNRILPENHTTVQTSLFSFFPFTQVNLIYHDLNRISRICPVTPNRTAVICPIFQLKPAFHFRGKLGIWCEGVISCRHGWRERIFPSRIQQSAMSRRSEYRWNVVSQKGKVGRPAGDENCEVHFDVIPHNCWSQVP